MKTLIAVTVMAVSVAACAEAAKKSEIDAKVAEIAKKAEAAKKPKMTRAQIENRPEVLKKTGGFVDCPASGTAIVVVDARAKAGGAPDQFATVYRDLSKMLVVVEKTPLKEGTCPVTLAAERLAANKAAFAMVVIDEEKYSGLMVIPEDRLVVVNAAKYKEGPDPVRREERVIKELWRGLGFVSGIGYAPFKNDVFQPVYTIPELDALEYQVMQPMNFQKMYGTMAKYGVKRARHIPYRLACMEGWAAQPTNEYQKAVWEQVHKLPEKPIKIEYNEKRDKGK